VEEPFWKRLWTCRESDRILNNDDYICIYEYIDENETKKNIKECDTEISHISSKLYTECGRNSEAFSNFSYVLLR
jgi:CRISPR/Cas system CSM-associated protein Csm2 small subunit